MYIIENKKIKYKLADKKELTLITGFPFGKKSHKIAGEEIIGLTIYNKKLANPIVKKQVDKKYKKLIELLTELLVSDDDSGDSIREALNQIEKFRQIIKNKYRDYLTRKDLEVMSKGLSLIQKEAKNKMMEIENYNFEKEVSRSSCK